MDPLRFLDAPLPKSDPPEREQWRGATPEQRARWKEVFIPHPKAVEAIRTVYEHVKQCRIERSGSGIVVVGETGAGKTHLVKFLIQQFAPWDRETTDRTLRPLINIKVPLRCTPIEFGRHILARLGDPLARRTRTEDLDTRVRGLMKDCEVRLVIIDNFHDIPERKGVRGVHKVCTWLRELIDDTPVLFLSLGDSNARDVFDNSPQLKRRASHRCELQYFNPEGKEGAIEFARVIKNISAYLPVAEEVSLLDKDTIMKLYMSSAGIFAYLAKFLNAACFHAVGEGRESLNEADLGAAFAKVHGNAYSHCNPFLVNMKPRLLSEAGEPFHELACNNGKRDEAA